LAVLPYSPLPYADRCCPSVCIIYLTGQRAILLLRGRRILRCSLPENSSTDSHLADDPTPVSVYTRPRWLTHRQVSEESRPILWKECARGFEEETNGPVDAGDGSDGRIPLFGAHEASRRMTSPAPPATIISSAPPQTIHSAGSKGTTTSRVGPGMSASTLASG
jgi:hypothetical protein